MTLSPAIVDQHIGQWQEKLSGPTHPHRQHWPSRLFHHTPLENAVKILQGGCLRSRNDPQNDRVRDVAAAEVNEMRRHAHDFVRLYFRPRTPTQFNIEGIRKAGECKYGEDTHAPVLFMLVLKCKAILLSQGVRFSDRNMQTGHVQVDDTENFFSGIPFEKVFHEGGIAGDRSIIEHRCAEVLVTSPLALDGNLEYIYCRSEAERQTLLYFLGASAAKWSRLTRVSDDLRVFDKKFVFVENISLSREGIIFQLNPRSDRRQVSIRIRVWNEANALTVDFQNNNFDAVPPKVPRWIHRRPLNDSRYRVAVELEGHLAFESWMTLADAII